MASLYKLSIGLERRFLKKNLPKKDIRLIPWIIVYFPKWPRPKSRINKFLKVSRFCDNFVTLFIVLVYLYLIGVFFLRQFKRDVLLKKKIVLMPITLCLFSTNLVVFLKKIMRKGSLFLLVELFNLISYLLKVNSMAFNRFFFYYLLPSFQQINLKLAAPAKGKKMGKIKKSKKLVYTYALNVQTFYRYKNMFNLPAFSYNQMNFREISSNFSDYFLNFFEKENVLKSNTEANQLLLTNLQYLKFRFRWRKYQKKRFYIFSLLHSNTAWRYYWQFIYLYCFSFCLYFILLLRSHLKIFIRRPSIRYKYYRYGTNRNKTIYWR